MKPDSIPILLIGLLSFGAGLLASCRGQAVVINGTAVPPVESLDAAEIARGEILYAQHCAACHGVSLQGAENWRQPLDDGTFPAPPHDNSGHTWHHPDFLLLEIIAHGGILYGGSMPGFSTQLTEHDSKALLSFIKSHWEHEKRNYQWWITNTYPTPTPDQE